MSISTLTTLSAARSARKPTKRDVGKATAGDADKDKQPGLVDLLVTAIPTELVAPYTALSAIIVGAIDEPTKKVPEPDEFEFWRWLIFGVLLLATFATVWRGTNKKSDVKRFPALEIGVAVVAAIGWALALPNSPLIPYIEGASKSFVPAVAAFVAAGLILSLGGRLQKSAKQD